MEGYTLNSTAGNAAPVGGRRRSHKKLRLVKKKTVRKMLSKMGLKMRGGADAPAADAAAAPAAPAAPATAGRRRRHRRGGADEEAAAPALTAGRKRRGGRKSRKLLGMFKY